MLDYEELKRGFETAYIDGSVISNEFYRPQFVSNNHREGKKVISSIEDELLRCDEFKISVAFITLGGITPLLQTLKELERKGIPGQILTTNYLTFSEPSALEKLNSLTNITLKMYDSDASGEGFHTKGYIFREKEIYRIIIGSSNMTGGALKSNFEWNTKLVSTSSGEITSDIIREFNDLWNSTYSRDYADFIEEYKERYNIIKHQRDVAKEGDTLSFEKYNLKPNSMQVGFIANLKRIIESGANKALLISATGTGKTYASAFAMRELGFKRVLFVAHRDFLIRQAKESFGRVFSNSVSMGIEGSGIHESSCDYVFAMVATLNRDNHLSNYGRDDFDCVILDECHRSTANTYQKIMNYFRPKLFLGMTATPDKRDDNEDGRNVYELYDHQIAYEIRLQQAMEENLLCPFHYFGITDLTIIDDEKNKARDFSVLSSDERIKHIVEQANYYGYSGDRVKGLIFCSCVEETRLLSEKFNRTINPATGKYYRTIALNSSSSETDRKEAFERLAMNEEEATYKMQPLDYIFSRDILNEGVDIVEVNQVIMLRPTDSPIVFIQQLGRGLRKADGKEYVVILDFIGNYQNNFMIPIALSGDRTYNKDNIRRYLMEGGKSIPGASTVHFDEISRSRIYEAIDRMSTTMKMLTDKYNALKERLGKIPSILDFYLNGEIDPMLFVEQSKSYDQFVRKVDKDYQIVFSEKEEKILEFVSNIIMNGKRIHELLMFIMLIERGEFSSDDIRNMLNNFGETYREEDYISAYHVITKDFINSPFEKSRYCDIEFIDKSHDSISQVKRIMSFYDKLKGAYFQKELETLIEYGIRRYQDMYSHHDENNLVLYQKYSRKDVCRILNWEKDDSSTMYGYRIKYGTCPIFVTYEKSDNIANSTKYPDEFDRISSNPDVYSSRIFSWMTRSKVSISSPEAQQIIHARENGLKILLFLKKSDGEGTDFYYMGEVRPIMWNQTTITNDKNEVLPIMNFKLELKQEARKDIFDYFTA